MAFIKNCTQNIIEVKTAYGTIQVNPNQYAKFEPINQHHQGKYYLKTPGQLKQFLHTTLVEEIDNINESDYKWFNVSDRPNIHMFSSDAE